ncbi:hypothetical protein K439DRAFT_1610995 [Ramaria rubella]|nr:hypothetical protein K439DRAFT_1610995 [Ramaria rubella]
MVRIGCQVMSCHHYKGVLEELEEDQDDDAQERKRYQDLLQEAEKEIDSLNEFYGKVTKDWALESLRVLGHVAHSPPISIGSGPERFTEDWALIELHGEKINWEAFKGNVIDLGTTPSVVDFMLKMQPHPTTSFKYPFDRLFQLQDILKENELRHPTMLDANGEECLLVIKSSNSTGVTIGRGTGIMSFVREYFEDATLKTSMEVAIYPYGYKDGAFSAPGDSGSIIADGKGRIVGLLTGRTGQTDSTDVTYATPFYWLFEERIKAHFPNAHLYPVTSTV